MAAAAPMASMPQAYSRDRRDSLDDLVDCNIPGLQGHYQEKKFGSASQQENMLYAAAGQTQSLGRGGNGGGSISGSDYASQLKAQIAMNDSIRKSDGEYSNPYSRDSLDDLVDCNIPGLQGHYQEKKFGSASQQENMLYAAAGQTQSLGRGGNGGGSISGSDYASQLKAQIAMNDSIRKSDGEYSNPYSRGNRVGSGRSEGKENSWGGPGGGSDSRSGSRSSYEPEYNSQSQKRSSYATAVGAEYQSTAHTSTRIRAPPGGKTSFSIGWD